MVASIGAEPSVIDLEGHTLRALMLSKANLGFLIINIQYDGPQSPFLITKAPILTPIDVNPNPPAYGI